MSLVSFNLPYFLSAKHILCLRFVIDTVYDIFGYIVLRTICYVPTTNKYARDKIINICLTYWLHPFNSNIYIFLLLIHNI